MNGFVQDAPRRSNRWQTDSALRGAVRRMVAREHAGEIGRDLDAFGAHVAGELAALGERAEAHPPRHVPFDAWGGRIDRIDVHPSWSRLVAAGLEAGLVAVPHERRWGSDSRTVQAALIQLFVAPTATAACPLAMTDATATALAAHDDDLAARYVPRLTARADAWTSGQWMTEKEGGSDVSRTATVARRAGDTWRLHGTKWFTSATTANMALALARPEGAEAGSAGLSLFAVELRSPDGGWNGIRVRRLKDKLGTRGLPTAELDLEGAVAVPVGGLGRGVPKVTTMLNVARLWSSAGAVSHAGELLALARDYAGRRLVFGKPLRSHPIHLAWLAELATSYEAALLLQLRAATTVGTVEAGGANRDLARLAPTLAKHTVTRQSVDLCSQLVESFGGAGYLEDTGLPRMLRDAHVEVIWEGTTSVMAHDLLRAIDRHPDSLGAWQDEVARLVASADDRLAGPRQRVRAAAAEVARLAVDPAPGEARRLATAMGRTWQAALLTGHATEDLRQGDGRLAAVAHRFAATPLVPAAVDGGATPGVALGEPMPSRAGAPVEA